MPQKNWEASELWKSQVTRARQAELMKGHVVLLALEHSG